MRKTVLIVEDESNIRQVVANFFKNSNYYVIEAEDGPDAIEKFKNNCIDLIILDVMLPLLDGWTVLKKIRETSKILVIMLTALGSEEDIIHAFNSGADEYVTKPFSPKVLVARANALVERMEGKAEPTTNTASKYVFDPNNLYVYISGEKIDLTLIEYSILEYLYKNANNALTRQQMLDTVWGYDYFGDGRVVDTHIKNLRKKLNDEGECIKTVKGIGYRMEISNEK